MSDDVTTIQLAESVRETLRERQRPGESASDTVDRLLDDEQPDSLDAPDMDGVESSLQAIEERTGRMERTLEELAEGRR